MLETTNSTLASIIILSLLLLGTLFAYSWFFDNVKHYKKQIAVVFRYDDYSSLSSPDLETSIIQTFMKYRFPITLGVIPRIAAIDALDPKEQELIPLPAEKIAILRELVDSGIVEIAQHGYSHQTSRERTQGGLTEFDGLEYECQLKRIADGKSLLEEKLGTEISTFIPPYNSYDLNTLHALESLGFQTLSADIMFVPRGYSGLRFLPATVDLLHLHDAIEVARSIPERRPVIVVLLHPYDLSGNRQILTFQELENLLSWTLQQKDVRVISVNQTVRMNNEDFGMNRYVSNSRAAQKNVSLIPPFLQFFHPSVYLGIRTISKLRIVSILLSIAYYCLISMVSINIARVFSSFMSKELSALVTTYRQIATAFLLALSLYVFRNLTLGYRGLTVLAFALSAIGGIWGL